MIYNVYEPLKAIHPIPDGAVFSGNDRYVVKFDLRIGMWVRHYAVATQKDIDNIWKLPWLYQIDTTEIFMVQHMGCRDGLRWCDRDSGSFDFDICAITRRSSSDRFINKKTGCGFRLDTRMDEVGHMHREWYAVDGRMEYQCSNDVAVWLTAAACLSAPYFTQIDECGFETRGSFLNPAWKSICERA